MSKLKLRLSNMAQATWSVIGRDMADSKVYAPNHCAILLCNREFLNIQGKGMHNAVVKALAPIFVDKALASSLSNPIPPTSKIGRRLSTVA